MNAIGGIAAFGAAAALICWCGDAHVYRPFDGTDAAVAETSEMEIELGPAEYQRDGSQAGCFRPI